MAVRSRFFAQVGRFSILFLLNLEEGGEICIDLNSSATFYESGTGFDCNLSPGYRELHIPYPVSDTEMETILKKLAARSYKAASGKATQRMLDQRPETGTYDPERHTNDNPQRLSEFQRSVFEDLLQNWDRLKLEIPSLLEERERCRVLYEREQRAIALCPFKEGQRVRYKDHDCVISNVHVVYENHKESILIAIDQLNKDGFIIQSWIVSHDKLEPVE